MNSRTPRRRQPSDSLLSPENRTDAANARRFVEEHGERARYCPAFKKWLVWDGKRWVIQERGQVIELARQTAARLIELAKTTPDFKEGMQFAKQSNSKKGLEAMVSVAESHSEIVIQPSDLDSDPYLLNCQNGMLDLRTQELLPHHPEKLITKLCPTTFDPDADAPRWRKFLASILPSDVVEFLQRWFGYCLTGDVREQSFLIFRGSGANGKSTSLEVIRDVFGEDFCVPVPNDLIVETPRDTHPTAMIDLEGRRLATFSETSKGQRLDEVKIKQLTGGDQLSGRRMRENNRRFKPTHKLILATNHLPRLSGDDKALRRRLILVSFGRQFWNPDRGESGPANRRQDKGLVQRLKMEASGILNWLVIGCRDWQERELEIPQSIIDEINEYRAKADSVSRFLLEYCEQGPEFSESASRLYDRFRISVEANRNPDGLTNQRAFGQRLAQEGFERFHSNGIRYRGLRLKQGKSPNPKLDPTRPIVPRRPNRRPPMKGDDRVD